MLNMMNGQPDSRPTVMNGLATVVQRADLTSRCLHRAAKIRNASRTAAPHMDAMATQDHCAFR